MTLGATPTPDQVVAELGSELPYVFPTAESRWLADVGASDPIIFPTSFTSKTSVKTVASSSAGGSGNSHTFSGLSFGSAFTGRVLVACIGLHDGSTGSARDQLACTIGGVSASGDDSGEFITGKTAGGGVWAATVPTGTTGDVTVTWSGSSVADVGIILLSVSNISATAHSETASWNGGGSGGTGSSKTLNIPANGVLIACMCHANGNAATMSGVTKRTAINFGTTATLTVGFDNRMSLETGRSVGASWSGATAYGGEARSYRQG